MSEPILYRHFASKRDLYLAALDHVWSKARASWEATLASTANVRDATIAFGDGGSQNLGSIGAQAQTSHTYTSSGQFTARVTATDATGASEFAVTTVTIGSLSVSLAASPNPVNVNNPTVLTATVPSSSQIVSYTFTFDDHTQPITTASNTVSHTFTTRGTHTVRVNVTAENGCTWTARGLIRSAGP